MPLQLLPAANQPTPVPTQDGRTTPILPLLPGDPLAEEQFCLVLTPWLNLVMVLGERVKDEPALMLSFMPEVIQQAWDSLRPRIALMSSHQLDGLDDLMHQFAPTAPDYTTVMQFHRLLLENLSDPIEEIRSSHQSVVGHRQEPTSQKNPVAVADYALPEPTSPDVELLQAIAHEVRTPLTTIRTLTRSLLKRTDLSDQVVKRLQAIDRECSEQIDRFGLFFRAVELETTAVHHSAMPLTRTSLAQVFQQSIPRWQQQASQRQLMLDIVLPQNMPTVVTDPSMLDQALTSLIERFTRSLPAGSHIRVEVLLAGEQLKVQLQSQPETSCSDSSFSGCTASRSKPAAISLGQLLMFQPETGILSLNLSATKSLFQAMGGKLIVRQRPKQGEVLTVFLPLEINDSGVLGIDDSQVLEV
jgi:signal transduction histidine kinase